MDLLKDHFNLIKDIVENNCILFFGAGVSQSAGISSSSKLSIKLAKELIKSMKKSNQEISNINRVTQNEQNLLEIAEFYHNFYGNNKIKKRICEILECEQKDASKEIFDNIINLPRNDIITTNYDSLIEDNFAPADRTVIWKEEQLSDYDSLKYNIFKIHGTIHDPTSIVVLKDDYSKFKNSGLYKYLIGQLQTRTLVVIGYSLSDTDFRDFYSEANPQKKLFIVARKENTLVHNDWKNKGATIIEIDAENFFISLIEAINKYKEETPIEEIKSVPRGIKKEDNNPFKFYTTDGLKPEQFFELYKSFIPPDYSDFSKIYNVDKHHIIQGIRGTGKTVLLRGLSIENLLSSNQPTNYIGFWLPFSTSYLGSVKRHEDEKDDLWYKFFASYLNILIVEKICESLVTCEKKKYLDFEKNKIESFVKIVFRDFRIDNNNETLKTLYEEVTRIRSAYHVAYDRSTFKIRVDPTYLRIFINHLEYLHNYFNDKYFFIVLDDAHFMIDENQKKVLVSFLSHREHPISFKIGTKEEFGVYTDFFGATIQEGKDYENVYLDRSIGRVGAKDYKNFLESLANKRLEAFGQDIKIKELLPKGEYKKGELYSGFGDYVTLSSQIIRDFITLIKDTIYYANPQIAREYLPLKSIPPNVQNEVISIKSSIHLKEVDAAGDLREDVSILIDTLGALFKKILTISQEVSPESELRTVSGIEIKNYHNLDKRTKEALDKAVELSLLQIPIVYRIRQKMDSPYFGVKFHKLLIPYYRLKLPYRYPRTIDASLLNMIFTDSDTFVEKLTKNLKNKEILGKEKELEHAQKEIDYYD